MNPTGLLNTIITRVNSNPLNHKKIYLTFTQIINIDKSVTLEVKFGISEKNSLIFREELKEGENIEIYKDRLFSKVIESIFYNIYDRMDSNTFQDNGWSKIVRVDN